MYYEADNYCEKQMNDRKEQEKELRTRLLDIYENSNEDIKLIISMLIHTEFERAIYNDNYIRIEERTKENPNYNKADNLIKYQEENKDLINKVW